MVKYALILAFSYPKTDDSINIQPLCSVPHDIKMIYDLCKSLSIQDSNITIVTDVSRLPDRIYNCNIRSNPFPSDIFVCREICQFLENTIRGIEETTFKCDNDFPEVLLYISGHGSNLIVDDELQQGIVLYNESGDCLKYLLSKDIFNIMFGNLDINIDGYMNIPLYSALKRYKKIENEFEIRYVPETLGLLEPITVRLSPPVASPINSPDMIVKPYRSTYLANRGVPFSTRMLIIVDTCYSEHMTYFPYIYDPKSQKMLETLNSNVECSSSMPYCISISSCERDRKTVATSSGSSLTKILHMNLLNQKININIAQLHYIIYNSNNGIINQILRNGSSHPIITSTHSNSNLQIPFFSNFKPKTTTKIIK